MPPKRKTTNPNTSHVSKARVTRSSNVPASGSTSSSPAPSKPPKQEVPLLKPIAFAETKAELSAPKDGNDNTVWVIIENGKNIGVRKTEYGAVRAVEECMLARLKRAVNCGPGTENFIQDGGLLGVMVKAGKRKEVVKVQKFELGV